MKQLVSLCRNPIHLLSLGLGSGLSPKAPGTFGTVAGLIIYIVALQHLSLVPYVVVLIVSFGIGCYLCGATADALKVHDHPAIVWDEFVGFWLAALLLPSGWLWLVAAFVLFRFFDIIKPWPISILDKRMKGGLGIMIDDIVAGLFALLILQAANFYY